MFPVSSFKIPSGKVILHLSTGFLRDYQSIGTYHPFFHDLPFFLQEVAILVISANGIKPKQQNNSTKVQTMLNLNNQQGLTRTTVYMSFIDFHSLSFHSCHWVEARNSNTDSRQCQVQCLAPCALSWQWCRTSAAS